MAFCGGRRPCFFRPFEGLYEADLVSVAELNKSLEGGITDSAFGILYRLPHRVIVGVVGHTSHIGKRYF